MTTPTTDRKPAHPLRGLVVGAVLAVILFPAVRTMAGSILAGLAGLAAGAFIAAFVHAAASTRR